MIELFAKPAVGAIIEKTIDGNKFILLQQRSKENGGIENGMYEIPAGKVREFENVFDTLRREVMEETGLTITSILGEENVVTADVSGYKTISFSPFCSTQNLSGGYSILLHTFLCQAEGALLEKTNESINIRWVSIDEIRDMLLNKLHSFYPMHINALFKYTKLQE